MASLFSLSNLFLQFPFLLFSLSNLLYHSSGIRQSPRCHDGDRALLLQFKQSFFFDEFSCDPSIDYSKLGSWKVADDCCSWDGVRCDDQTGHVIGLNLSRSCVFGSINSTNPLFQLVHLKTLDLSLNNFNLSTIPRGIRSLSKLTHLNLTLSNFFGQVPSEVLQLSNLVSLDLEENLFMLRDPSLKDIATTLTNLNELHLSGVNISSSVPQSLSNLTSLTSLLLQDCSLQGEFPPAIFQLPNLRALSLMYNQDLTGYLPELQVGNRLEMLRLDATNFTGQLPKSIGNFKSLSYFSARRCGFVGLIPSSIGNLTKLNVLHLSENHFAGKIPSYFSNLLQLTDLALSHNNFSSNTLHWLGKLTNLQSVKLMNTNLDGFISASLRNLTKLTILWLHSNHLTGSIPPWIGNLTRLVSLDFGYNELNGQIPESIFRLPNLESLYLDINKFSGSLKPDSFLQMKNLSELDLSRSHLSLINIEGNRMDDVFPSWLGILPHLRVLSLRSNKFHGGIGKPLGEFQFGQLQIIDLSDNYFTGRLPLEYLRNWFAMKSIDDDSLAYMHTNTSFTHSATFTWFN